MLLSGEQPGLAPSLPQGVSCSRLLSGQGPSSCPHLFPRPFLLRLTYTPGFPRNASAVGVLALNSFSARTQGRGCWTRSGLSPLVTPGPSPHPQPSTCDLSNGNRNGPDRVVRAGQRRAPHGVRRGGSVWPLLWGALRDRFRVCPDPLSPSPVSLLGGPEEAELLVLRFLPGLDHSSLSIFLKVGSSLPRPQRPPAPPARPLPVPIAVSALSLQPCALPLTVAPRLPPLYKHSSPRPHPSPSPVCSGYSPRPGDASTFFLTTM